MNIIAIKNLSKSYDSPQGTVPVLANIFLDVNQGESIAIVGESGRGKTTLLYLLSGLDQADTGSILINGYHIDQLDETELALFRANNFGFVFQHHFLLNDLDALDNTLLPLRISKKFTEESMQEILELFHYFGLEKRLHHFPDELSGGEKQRISLIRALATKPLIIFADEPTGSLDKENAKLLEELLFELTKKQNTTLILSTHNTNLAQKCDKIYSIDDLEQ